LQVLACLQGKYGIYERHFFFEKRITYSEKSFFEETVHNQKPSMSLKGGAFWKVRVHFQKFTYKLHTISSPKHGAFTKHTHFSERRRIFGQVFFGSTCLKAEKCLKHMYLCKQDVFPCEN
jgi:hypothetical protein